jgi:hypothetical protein
MKMYLEYFLIEKMFNEPIAEGIKLILIFLYA